MKALKPVRKVKDNYRYGDASYLASGSCREIIATVNLLFNNGTIYSLLLL